MAATSLPAQIFGLVDRGVIQAGARADLLLVQGDPTADITATQDLTSVWVLGRPVDGDAYPGSAVEREGIVWQKQSTAKIVKAIEDLWPDFPTPQDVAREDGELLGRVVPTSGGWQAMTTFNAPLGTVTTHDAAIELLHARGLTCLVEPWWVRTLDDSAWREAELVEVGPDRIRLRWMDRMIDQPPSGQWFDLDDIDLTNQAPTS